VLETHSPEEKMTYDECFICNNFRNRQIVPKIPTDQLSVPVETRGGFRKRKNHHRSKKIHSRKRFTRR
jgi:hypothetical protein